MENMTPQQKAQETRKKICSGKESKGTG